MNLLKNICTCLVGGALLQALSTWLASDFLSRFLEANLITLLIALLAINTTTISVIMTKLREITERNAADFARSIREMKVSIIEQVVLVVVAVLVQIVMGSTQYQLWPETVRLVLSTILASIFVYSVYILWDTANGVFVILKYEKDKVS